ncbi:mitochondrial amidoxime reducing component 2 [Megalopta genalis]|uniref:mitochondrial amidoxime reducing component 2 n=1 Tax=Megalopta genalis TaxID=115081 RepID=UPI003FCFEE92
MDRMRLTYMSAVAVGAGTVVVFIWWWWKTKSQKDRPPTQWRKVGELSDLIAFPIKSLGPVRLNTMECTKLGLKSGWMRDRTLMVIDLNGHFVTARQWPRMVLVSPSVSGSVLTLSAPGMMSMSIDLSRIQGKSFRVAVWGQPVAACDCGEEAARWLSRFLLLEDTGFRLVYYPLSEPKRSLREKSKKFGFTSDDPGAYPDESSYCLMNEASVADLNTRLEEAVNPDQFRPNFVVKGALPYEEDGWRWIKIGNVVFKNLMPCTRCILTTVSPETGTKCPNVEPLKTLKSYRQAVDPELRRLFGESPIMGFHLGIRGRPGSVRLGDSVYVGVPEEQPPLISPP